MKKLLFVLAAAVLAFVSCDKDSEISKSGIVGSWKVVEASVVYDGEREDVTEDFSSEVWIFKQGGEFMLYDMSVLEESCQWELNGNTLKLKMSFYEEDELIPYPQIASNAVAKSAIETEDEDYAISFKVKALTSGAMTLEGQFFDGEPTTIKFKKINDYKPGDSSDDNDNNGEGNGGETNSSPLEFIYYTDYFSSNGGEGSITFYSTAQWSVLCIYDWVHVSPKKGLASPNTPVEVRIEVDSNKGEERTATLRFYAGEVYEDLTISQEGR